jgi:hypothetical protein
MPSVTYKPFILSVVMLNVVMSSWRRTVVSLKKNCAKPEELVRLMLQFHLMSQAFEEKITVPSKNYNSWFVRYFFPCEPLQSGKGQVVQQKRWFC